MNVAGVQQAAIVTPSTMRWDNNVTFDAVDKHPDRFVAVVRVDTSDADGMVNLRDLLHRGAVGVRITLFGVQSPPTLVEKVADQMGTLLSDRNGVAEFHVSPEQLSMVEAFSIRHPNLRIVIDHLGRPVPGTQGSEEHQNFLRLADRPNVFAKTPGLGFFSEEPFPHGDLTPFLHAALDCFGAERIMWGSDWPGSDEFSAYQQTLNGMKIQLARRSAAERAAVLSGTFERLFLSN